jgi:hypothetical protein
MSATPLRLEIQHSAISQIVRSDTQGPVLRLQWYLGGGCSRVVYFYPAALAKNQTGNAFVIAVLFLRPYQTKQRNFPFAHNAKISTGQLEQLPRQNTEPTAAKYNRTPSLLTHPPDQITEFPDEDLAPPNQNIIDVAYGDTDQVGLGVAQNCGETIILDQQIEQEDLVARSSQSSAQVRQPQWKHRLRFSTSIGANQ